LTREEGICHLSLTSVSLLTSFLHLTFTFVSPHLHLASPLSQQVKNSSRPEQTSYTFAFNMDESILGEAAFDSSDGLEEDDDWDRSQFRNKSQAGKRQAETIIANQAADRATSKRNCRRLTYAMGAPSTQDARSRVECTWDAFYEGLKVE
jgi:hypothetical protein